MQRFSSFFCLFAFFSIILCAERACLRLRDAFEGKRRKPLAGVLCLTTLLAYSGLVQTSFLFSAFLLFFAFPRPHVISLAAPACALPRCTLGFFFKKNFHLIVVQFLFLCTGLPTSHLVFFFFFCAFRSCCSLRLRRFQSGHSLVRAVLAAACPVAFTVCLLLLLPRRRYLLLPHYCFSFRVSCALGALDKQTLARRP